MVLTVDLVDYLYCDDNVQLLMSKSRDYGGTRFLYIYGCLLVDIVTHVLNNKMTCNLMIMVSLFLCSYCMGKITS